MTEITVLMPVYNAMPYLPEAIDSIRRQTLRSWIMWVIDDGSHDGSAEYLDSIHDPRIRVVHRQNQGPAAATNYALGLCETELVARMDADDIALPARLEKQIAFMRGNPQVGLVGTQIRPLGECRQGRPSQLPTTHREIYQALIHGRHALCNPTIMCRTELLRQIGGYQADGVSEDWAMFLHMGERAELANLDQVLLSYRIHAGSTNSRHMRALRRRIAFACDRARRKQAGREPIDYQQYLARCRQASWRRRLAESSQTAAMLQYRRAQTDLLGRHPWRGYLRLALAASLSPLLTWHRITRGFRKHLGQRRAGTPPCTQTIAEPQATTG